LFRGLCGHGSTVFLNNFDGLMVYDV
jgi:hypothetical protein